MWRVSFSPSLFVSLLLGNCSLRLLSLCMLSRWFVDFCIFVLLLVDRFYIALLSAFEQTPCARMWFYTSESLFTAFFFCFFFPFLFNSLRSDVLTALAWLVPQETAAVSVRSMYIIQPCTMALHKSHVSTVHACLAVTSCRLHFWQNDRDLLRATAITPGWNGYRNKSPSPTRMCLAKQI